MGERAPARALVTVSLVVLSGCGMGTESREGPGTGGEGGRPPGRTSLVTEVVDGDTLALATGEVVRLAGIDAPERGECGYDEATRWLQQLTLGEQVHLGRSDEDRDRYGRLLRYVDVRGVDAGLRLIEEGLAVARYDSRDGYGYHPREARYVAADAASPDRGC